MKNKRNELTQAHVVLMVALTNFGHNEFDVHDLTELYLKSPLYREIKGLEHYSSYDEYFKQRVAQVYSYLSHGYGAGVGNTATTLGNRIYRIENVSDFLANIRVAIDCITDDLK